MKREISEPWTLNCSCNLPGHMLHFWYDAGYRVKDHIFGPELSITVCMSPNAGIFRRMLTALKYVFGTKKNLWEYSDTLLDKEGIKKLQEYVTKCAEDFGEQKE